MKIQNIHAQKWIIVCFKNTQLESEAKCWFRWCPQYPGKRYLDKQGNARPPVSQLKASWKQCTQRASGPVPCSVSAGRRLQVWACHSYLWSWPFSPSWTSHQAFWSRCYFISITYCQRVTRSWSRARLLAREMRSILDWIPQEWMRTVLCGPW